jgi:hypothetical protein
MKIPGSSISTSGSVRAPRRQISSAVITWAARAVSNVRSGVRLTE